MEQQSYLSELEFTPVFASTGKRFANYLIDVIAFVFLWYIFLVIFISSGGVIRSYKPYSGPDLLFRLVILIFYAMFLFLCELIFKGRSVGKFITGTRAVDENGIEM